MKLFRLLTILPLMLLFFSARAGGDDQYSVTRISPAMLKNANAVVRADEMVFEIISEGKTNTSQHFVVTILNENGESWAAFSEYYSRFRKITSIDGELYDAMGKSIRKMKMKDAEDLSGSDESSLADDYRYKRHNFYHRVYPYTVEYTWSVEENSSLFFPNWVGLPGELVSVEKSSMQVICPLNYQFRYKAYNMKADPAVTQTAKTRTTTWNYTQGEAIVKESFFPLWHEVAPYIIFGPTSFQVGDYKGNMASWQEFGKFVYALKQGRDQLPESLRKKVHELADKLTDPKDKIRVLYQYLQKNTRYISIQLGIGGWQPFDAGYVAEHAYGDCKALTNFMYSLLKEAGIKSYYTLVRANRSNNYITADFPSQQFNHVILAVPGAADTTWLECTSQDLPAGFIGGFTGNRWALMIDEAGGKLVRTKTYSQKDNLESRKITGALSEDGSLNITSVTRYSGEQMDYVSHLINDLSKDKIKEELHEQFDLASYDISSFNFEENKSWQPFIDESISLTAANYASISGKRIFIVPNILNRWSRKYAADETRKYDIFIMSSYVESDSAEIDLPAGYEPESIPSAVNLATAFGDYSSRTELIGNRLRYYRVLRINNGTFPAKNYPELVKFYESIYKADRAKLVLVKKSS